MTSRIELRKEQQRIVPSNASSIGWVVGDAVVDAAPIWNPGILFPSGQEEHKGLLQLDKDLLVRSVSVDGTILITTLGSNYNTGLGLTINAKSNDVQLWKRIPVPENLIIDPDFGGLSSDVNLTQIRVTLNSGLRVGSTITNIITDRTTETITYGEVQPTWGPGFSADQYNSEGFIGRCRSVYITNAMNGRALLLYNKTRFDNLGNDVKFSSFNIGRLIYRFRRGSTKNNERYLENGQGSIHLALQIYSVPPPLDPETFYSLRAFGSNKNRTSSNGLDFTSTIYPQLTGYTPGRTETITTGTSNRQVNTFVPPPDVELSVNFLDAAEAVLETQKIVVPNIGDINQTLSFTYGGTSKVSKISFSIDDEYASWLQDVLVPYPKKFNNATIDTYNLTATPGAFNGLIIQVFAHAAPIDVPDIATLAGSRPNEYLTYSGTWDGSTFQSLRCRCPAWILYHVLTAERFGIELPTSRINAQSFLTASKYCQELINSKPRWSYDGLLQGTQTKIIQDLLNLMRGWLRNDTDGRLSLKIEKPEEARWIVCPAVIGQGRLDYRRSLERPAVRCSYTDRLTGQEAATEGLDNSRIVEVPWQDSDITQRWADWETFNDQNLLDSVEFTLPWRYHSIGIGDLIDLYDPQHIGVRPSGRILDSNATGKWVQLDGVPTYWPDKEATAQLKDYGRKTVIDPDVWGYSTFSFTGANPPSLQIQTEGGGYTSHAINEVLFSAGGRPEQNRVILDTFPTTITDRTTWAIIGKIDGDATVDIHPTKWRVQSVSENNTGREFRVVCTRYIDGMHNFIESGAALPDIKTQWTPKCGTNISQYSGHWDDLEQRYPADTTNPFDLSTTFDNLPSSCVV